MWTWMLKETKELNLWTAPQEHEDDETVWHMSVRNSRGYYVPTQAVSSPSGQFANIQYWEVCLVQVSVDGG